MAHQGVTRSAFAALAAIAFVAGCGDAQPRVQTATVPAASSASSRSDFPSEPTPLPTFHSKRFQLTVPLPDGRAWKVDDQSQPHLVATHAPTRSEIQVWTSHEPNLMNRQRCEERAREVGLVPKGPLDTLEDAATIGPEAYDSRVWVALAPPRKGQPIAGHVFLFGAFIRKCLVVHFSTEIPSDAQEQALSDRLAMARTRIVGAITLDPPRTSADVDLPRDKPKSP